MKKESRGQADIGGVKIVLAGALFVGLLACGSATAATSSPTAYRATLNGICRGYTPQFRALETWLNNAETTKSTHAIGLALGEIVGMSLKQDAQLEGVPVPPALKAHMRPILALMRKIDLHLRRSVVAAHNNNAQGIVAELNIVQGIGRPLNGMLDGAGLPDCGSNQT